MKAYLFEIVRRDAFRAIQSLGYVLAENEEIAKRIANQNFHGDETTAIEVRHGKMILIDDELIKRSD